MIRIITISTAALLISGCKTIDVPFFQSLKPADVCGAVPEECQPTSSRRWTSVESLDYRNPASIIGRVFSDTVYETRSCGLSVSDEDYATAGMSSVSGTLKRDGRSGFGVKASASLDDTLRDALGSLPDDVEAAAKAELRNTITSASQSDVNLNYFRVDLTNDFLDRNIGDCFGQMADGEKFVTGASVIETSGDWSRTRVSDFVASFEASAAYQSLDAETKAEWQSKKDLALTGSFSPVRYVFAVAYREK